MTEYIDPTKEQFAAFREMQRTGPIHMLNLVRLNARTAKRQQLLLAGVGAVLLVGGSWFIFGSDDPKQDGKAGGAETIDTAGLVNRDLSQREFVALMAMLFATVALAVDSMLPALPAIAATLSPEAPNLAQLVVTSFVFGMGFGTFISGPLSDAYGRKPVLIGCAAVYMAGAVLCVFAPTLETLLFARVLMGQEQIGTLVQ